MRYLLAAEHCGATCSLGVFSSSVRVADLSVQRSGIWTTCAKRSWHPRKRSTNLVTGPSSPSWWLKVFVIDLDPQGNAGTALGVAVAKGGVAACASGR